jgi:hypothetical protein
LLSHPDDANVAAAIVELGAGHPAMIFGDVTQGILAWRELHRIEGKKFKRQDVDSLLQGLEDVLDESEDCEE